MTIRQADLDGLLGLTEFDARTVTLAPDLTAGEWRATLAHELVHLLRGPVPHALAPLEEVAVQHETAALLMPVGPALAQIDRVWTDEEMQALAARYAVDKDIINTAVSPPTLPFPRVSDEST